jgi:GxxExxY protein
MTENQIGKIIVDVALHVHKRFGPGLLETVYEVILAHELEKRELKAERQVRIPILYEGIRFEEGFRADIIVDDKVIIELKSVEALNNAHKSNCLRI